MSVPEEETQELGVDAACGADDGGQEGDPMFVGVRALVLLNLLLGGLLHRPVEVVRVAKLAVLRRLVGCPPNIIVTAIPLQDRSVRPTVTHDIGTRLLSNKGTDTI